MSEAADFRNALNAAGQPWSRRGIRVAGGGIVALLALQVALMVGVPIPYALYVLIAVVVVIAVGWAMLIVAVLKRRQWAKEQAIAEEALIRDLQAQSPLKEAP
jgi:cobalamin biosynthesis protein CobD/CbiB